MQKRKILIVDTSIFCAWLEVPGKETCGLGTDLWDQSRVKQKIEIEEEKGTIFVLPLAAIIETGNHIAQAASRRYELARTLAHVIEMAADQQTPWAAFTDQSVLWEANGLKELAQEWPQLAVQGISIGDVTIKAVAEFYLKLGHPVEILTGDQGLKSYEPPPPPETSQRRRRRRRG
jgi:hypothetical protein